VQIVIAVIPILRLLLSVLGDIALHRLALERETFQVLGVPRQHLVIERNDRVGVLDFSDVV